MKFKFNIIALTLTAMAGGALALPAAAQNQVYRCGNEYTNSTARIEQGGCKPVTGGNLTVVRGSAMRSSNGVRTSSSTTQRSSSSTPAASTTVKSDTQRARDENARNILQMEFDKATKRLAELQKEYNNGKPDKLGPETRNYQKYLDRVAELKSSIARTESDIEGIRRELSRLGG